MHKPWINFLITVIVSGFVGVQAASVVEDKQHTIAAIDTDYIRILVAFCVGSVVQLLTLVATERWYERFERQKKGKATRAIFGNLSEVALTGILASVVVAILRFYNVFGGSLALEFVASAIAGSYGAEKGFKFLEKYALSRVNKSVKDGDKDE